MDDISDGIAVPYGDDWEKWGEWAESMPISRELGIDCTFRGPGSAEVRIAESTWPLNGNGAVHGGMVAALADHCFGIVGMSMVDDGAVPATSTLGVDYVRPAFPPLRCECEVDRAGRTLLFVTVRVYNAKDKLATKVTGTMVVDGSSRHVPRSE